MQATTPSSATSESDATDLIGAIYDAAINPAVRPQVLEATCEFIGCDNTAAAPGESVSRHPAALPSVDNGVRPEDAGRCSRGRSAAIGPGEAVPVAEVGRAAIPSHRADDHRDARFFRELLCPPGPRLNNTANVLRIERRGDSSVQSGGGCGERDGCGSEVIRERLLLLEPHMRRAITIRGLIGAARNEADTLREAFDGLEAGVFFVDAEGRLLHSNDAGRSLLGGPHANASQLTSTPLRLDRTVLRDLVPGIGQSFVAKSHVVDTEDGERMVVSVLPLTRRARTVMGVGSDAAAALFVRPATFDPSSIPEALVQAFDLTPAELRVALATLKHDKVADVADTLGVAETTVKTHLSRVFAKTDTKRQADIVKLVAAFASPLANDTQPMRLKRA